MRRGDCTCTQPLWVVGRENATAAAAGGASGEVGSESKMNVRLSVQIPTYNS